MTVAFVDTETLGLDADVQPIWELAWITDQRERCYQLRVTPRDLQLAHPWAIENMGDRYDREKAHSAGGVLDLFAHEVRGMHLCGAVISFDEERLRRLCWKHGVAVTWHYHLIDVEALVVGFLAGMARPAKHELLGSLRWDSEALSKAVGVDPGLFDKHTALGDARWAKALYEVVMGK